MGMDSNHEKTQRKVQLGAAAFAGAIIGAVSFAAFTMLLSDRKARKKLLRGVRVLKGTAAKTFRGVHQRMKETNEELAQEEKQRSSKGKTSETKQE